MTECSPSVQVDESGAGSAGIRQYVNQLSSRLIGEFVLSHTGKDGSKIARTLDSIRASRKIKADIFWAVAPSLALAFSRAETKILTVHDLRPFIDSHGDSWATTTYRKLAFSSAIRSADSIICVSHRTLTDLHRYFPSMASKSIAIPLSGERSCEVSAEESPSENRTVSVIAHEHNKQAKRVVPAIKFLDADIQVNFLCGKHIAEWHREIAQIPNAHIVGFLPDEQYVQTIMESSAVVMLSNLEGFGIPIVEAQRLGTPVVISDDKALLEISTPDATVVSSAVSPQQLATAIMQAMAKRNNILRPGPYDARSWDDVAKDTVKIFCR